jgi:hypothetical protein
MKNKWFRFSVFSAIMLGLWTGATMLTFDKTVMLWGSVITTCAGLWTLFYLRVHHKLKFRWEK